MVSERVPSAWGQHQSGGLGVCHETHGFCRAGGDGPRVTANESRLEAP